MDRKDEPLYFRALIWLGYWTYTLWREVGSGIRIGMEDAGWSPLKESPSVTYGPVTYTDASRYPPTGRGW